MVAACLAQMRYGRQTNRAVSKRLQVSEVAMALKENEVIHALQ